MDNTLAEVQSSVHSGAINVTIKDQGGSEKNAQSTSLPFP